MSSLNPLAATGLHVAERTLDRSAWYSGWLLTFLATGEETNDVYSLTEVVGRRGASAAPPLHIHTREDECFYVIEGAIACYIDGREVQVPAGGFIILPRGVPHRYELASEEARLLNLCVSAGFEGFYRALSEPAQALTLPPAPEGPPEISRLIATAAAYGIEILGPPPADAAP
jgi:mannose-6-phosphate isomerase-like protein (cupin superfamily)